MREWAPKEDLVLGTMTDQGAADHLGLDVNMVSRRRRLLGIPAYGDHRTVDWSEHDSLLGKYVDRVVAEMIGCGLNTVAWRRNKLRIEPRRVRG